MQPVHQKNKICTHTNVYPINHHLWSIGIVWRGVYMDQHYPLSVIDNPSIDGPFLGGELPHVDVWMLFCPPAMSLGTASEHNASSKPPANRIAGFTSPTGVAESPCLPWRGRRKYETQMLFGTHPATKLQYVCMCMSIYSPTAVILSKENF